MDITATSLPLASEKQCISMQCVCYPVGWVHDSDGSKLTRRDSGRRWAV